MKYLKRFNESLMNPSDRDLAISETNRLIKTNHTINDNTKVLEEVFDKGYRIGELNKIIGDEFRRHQDVQFNFYKFFDNKVDDLDPKRIANNRDLKYNGPEIESYKVLVSDCTYQEALDSMKDKDHDYCDFNYYTGDEQRYKSNLDNLSKFEEDDSDEEREWLENNYNKKEVKILLTKLYQVGYSLGFDNTKDVPAGIRQLFSILNSDQKFSDDDAYDSYIARLKRENPTWEEYSKYLSK